MAIALHAGAGTINRDTLKPQTEQQIRATLEQALLAGHYVLTTGGSCSSSELVINALSPFIDVVQIGETTCGKPVGQVPDRVGGFRLFAINFQTVNALDFGDYFDGLMPNCPVAATVAGDWGVSTDPLYAEALAYIKNSNCSGVAVSSQSVQQQQAPEPVLPQWLRYNEQ